MLTSLRSERGTTSFLVLALVGVAVGGCSTGSGRMYGTGQMTTSSIEPPRPVEDMVQKPARPYDDGYSLGRHDEVPAAAAHQGRYQWNGNPDRLQEGTSTALPPAQANLAPDGRKLIVVRPGDTLYSISRQQGISIQDLMTANRLTGPTLSAGQTLVLPTTLR